MVAECSCQTTANGKEDQNTAPKMGLIADCPLFFMPKVKYHDGTVDRLMVGSVNFFDYVRLLGYHAKMGKYRRWCISIDLGRALPSEYTWEYFGFP
jgi:hypothetical protein